MPVVLITRCDGPGCESYMQTSPNKPPTGWLIVSAQGHNAQAVMCSWTCLALMAAQNATAYEKPSETVNPEEPEPNGHEPGDGALEATGASTSGGE